MGYTARRVNNAPPSGSLEKLQTLYCSLMNHLNDVTQYQQFFFTFHRKKQINTYIQSRSICYSKSYTYAKFNTNLLQTHRNMGPQTCPF